MSALREPPRWLSADVADEIAARLRPALRVARGQGPSAAELEHMWSSLAARLPLAAGGSAEPVADAAAAASGKAGTTLVRQAHAGLLRLVGTGIVAAALGFGAAKLTAANGVAHPPAAQPFASPRRAAPVSTPTVRVAESPSAIEGPLSAGSQTSLAQPDHGPRSVSAASRGPEASTSPSRPEQQFGTAANPRLTAADSTSGRPKPTAADRTNGPSDLTAELDLLARARRVVAGSPARALQLTAEHARRFSDGVLAQEREVLAIDALWRLGQRDLAAMRARRFSERYPDSAHRVRLDAELHGQ